MSKVRIYEIAKDLGVDSKVVIAKLAELGEFVKGASSSIEAPVARKLRAEFPDAPAAAPEKPAAKKVAVKKIPAKKVVRKRTAVKKTAVKNTVTTPAPVVTT